MRLSTVILFLTLLYTGVVCGMYDRYEVDVYDCSNMCVDQAVFFQKIGIGSDLACNYEIGHAWLILDICGMDVHWECTGLFPWLWWHPPVEERWDTVEVMLEQKPWRYEDFMGHTVET